MTKHTYLPTTLTSDKGAAFVSHVIKVVAGVLGITLKHAKTKHAQAIRLLERSHTSTKQTLKIETGEPHSLWHKYVSIEVLNYNTSCHASIGFEPSSVFYGRIHHNAHDLEMGIRSQKIPAPKSHFASDVLEQTELNLQDVRRICIQAYIKYKNEHNFRNQTRKFPRHFSEAERLCDGTNTDHYMQPDVHTSLEQPDPTPTNPPAQNMIYVIIQNQIAMTITDMEFDALPSTERIPTLSRNLKKCYGTEMRKTYSYFRAPSTLSEKTIKHNRSNHINFGNRRYWKSFFSPQIPKLS